MICYIPGCICYGSEIFGLGSLHDDNVGLVGAPPQLYSVAQYRCDYCFGISIFFGRWDFFSINQLIAFFLNGFVFYCRNIERFSIAISFNMHSGGTLLDYSAGH